MTLCEYSLTFSRSFTYPAYASMVAIETDSKDDDTQWLMYWVVFACFTLVEFFLDLVLYYLPFYFLFKLAFLGWCMAPQTRGALLVYDKFLRGIMIKKTA
jgi:receptor expression-enhancing protein 5/6